MPTRNEVLEVAGREVTISNPDKVFFPHTGHTKLDVVRYYLAVADGALRGVSGRPMALKRFVNGAEGEVFFQKRAPSSRPEWTETAELSFPSGRTAEEIVVRDPAPLAFHRGPAGGGRGGAGSGAAGSGDRQQQVVEGGAPRRVPRLQPERQGPDGGVRILRQTHQGRARLRHARLGRGA